MNIHRLLFCIFCATTFLHTGSVQAAWYKVEVIVFENLSPSLDGEVWHENPGLPERNDSIELISDLADEDELETESSDDEITMLREEDVLTPYLQLPESAHKLDGVYRILKLSREYRPHLHVSWQQPGLSSRRARAVHLQVVEEEELSTNEFSDSEPEYIESLQNTVTVEDLYQVLDLIFDGTLRLRSSRFLHVDVDMAFFPEFLSEEYRNSNTLESIEDESQADYVRLRESRKIKLNEIHYFDHPLFGVLLRVSRL